MRVLVVDDDPVVRSSCRRVLEAEGFAVVCAASAADAVDATLEQGFGLALVDIKMPEVDGLALMRMLKAEKRPVPVIAMSGYPTAETRASSLRSGASVFLPKPFTPDELLSALRAVMPAETGGVREE